MNPHGAMHPHGISKDQLLTLENLRQSLSTPIQEVGAHFRTFVIENLSVDRNRSIFKPQGKLGKRWITVSDDNNHKARVCIGPDVWRRAGDKGYRITDAVSIDVAIDKLWMDKWHQVVIEALAVRVSGQSQTEARREQINDYCARKGYFDRDKKSLPFLVFRVAIVTSRQSTIESDITNQIGLKKSLVDSYRFNGKADDLASLIHHLDKENYDVICLYRGGREDDAMFVFSDEAVLDEIVNARTPIVTALGHEQDIPPVQLVADKGYASPSRFAVEIREHNLRARKNICERSSLIYYYFKEYLVDLKRAIYEDNSQIHSMASAIKWRHEKRKHSRNTILIIVISLAIIAAIVFFFLRRY